MIDNIGPDTTELEGTPYRVIQGTENVTRMLRTQDGRTICRCTGTLEDMPGKYAAKLALVAAGVLKGDELKLVEDAIVCCSEGMEKIPKLFHISKKPTPSEEE